MRPSTMTHSAYDGMSSPDPLTSPASLVPHNLPGSKRAASSSATRKHHAHKASLESISILPPSSPSRTVTEQTLSPWRIRVTVEAEPEDQEGGLLHTITRTTQVPLRGGSQRVEDTDEHKKRPQSRPRAGSKSKPRQRNSTPIVERRRRQSVTDLDIVVLGDDADEDEWGRKQRKTSPRKSRAKKDKTEQNFEKPADSTSSQFEIRQDSDIEQHVHDDLRDESPELRQIDLNRVSVRSRANSTKQKVQSSDEAADDMDRSSLKPLPAQSAMTGRIVSANSAMTYPTPSPTASERGCSVEATDMNQELQDHAEGFDTIMESEGFTMIDLDTIPSVKNILSSPLEDQALTSSTHLMSPAESEATVRRSSPRLQSPDNVALVKPIRAIPPYLMLPEGESDISSTVPSSPPSFQPRSQAERQKAQQSFLQVPAQPRNRQVTPQTFSSPELPSPPRQSVLKDRSTPDSAKAMRAGLALQGAIEPIALYPALPHQRTPVIKDNPRTSSSSNELFEGFDSGTQRELRAGLRFGEELSKRQQPRAAANQFDTQHNRQDPLQIWRGESVISRTPVQMLQDQLQRSKRSSVISAAASQANTSSGMESRSEKQHLDTEARREHQWSLERQAVSQEIGNASPSKVIVIDSDEEGSDDTRSPDAQDQRVPDETLGDDDIWLEEAKDSSSSPRQEPELQDSMIQTRQADERRQPEDVPQRGTRRPIPSPWKRGEQNDTNNSTIITNGDETSGFLWKQLEDPEEAHFGDAAIKNVRKDFRDSGGASLVTRRTSGAFDIEKMLGTPKRIKDSLENAQSSPVSQSGSDQASSQEADEEADGEEEVSLDSFESTESISPVPSNRRMVPVKFNDSTLSQPQVTPPQPERPLTTRQVSATNPPTPRSAMKGSRQSFGAANGVSAAFDGADQAERRVIFAQRSRGVDVDWVESSSSVQLSTGNDISSPIVEHQKHQEERHSVNASSSQIEPRLEKDEVVTDVECEDQNPNQGQTGWLGWFRKNDQTSSDGLRTSSMPAPQVDGTSETSQSQDRVKSEPANHWAPTSRHSGQSRVTTAQSETKARSRQSGHEQSIAFSLPSYLLPPSYPSDPKRKISSFLASTGAFTNTHFRTLHILHRKSQRPRFHAPSFSSCRPDLRSLVAQKWKLEVDESDAGLGGFAWTVGETEARVLERFCREVEISSLHARGMTEIEVNEIVADWLDGDGIWGGSVSHGSRDVKWEWTVEELATKLGRIVVGEVVRDEEFGAARP